MGFVNKRRPLWDWAIDYVGDPVSHENRGNLIHQFLIENGLNPDSYVLNIGAGTLSEGAPLLRWLKPGHFTAIEPNGWLLEAAIDRRGDLMNWEPKFIYRSDFDASETEDTYDYVVSHSVMSHMAHDQMPQALANVRKVVREGSVWLSSIILDQYNSFDKGWVYPGVSTFRLETLRSMGFHAGWHIEQVPDYRTRMIQACPNDTHNWLRLTAVPSMTEINEIRLKEESAQTKERETLQAEEALRIGEAMRLDEELVSDSR